MYTVDWIVDGFPGKSSSHGSFGWSSVHLLRGLGRTILVETGPPSYIPLLSSALGRLGLDTQDVTDVLLTHSHWDHLSNIAMFPRAQVWIGRDELAWAQTLPQDAPFMSGLHIRELLARGPAVKQIAEGDDVLPGIHALAVSGHTPGHLAYVVECESGPVIFAGDAVKNQYELATSMADSTLDAAASSATIDRLRRLMNATGAVLVPGHDTPLQMRGGTAVRIRPQGARIGFFAGSDGEQDRSIDDGHIPDPLIDPMSAHTDRPGPQDSEGQL